MANNTASRGFQEQQAVDIAVEKLRKDDDSQVDALSQEKAICNQIIQQLEQANNENDQLINYIQNLEDFLVKKGLDFSSIGTSQTEIEKPDMNIINAVQPLLGAQARQISLLEMELAGKHFKLSSLQNYSEQTEKLHDQAISEFQTRFLVLFEDFKQEKRQLDNVKCLLQAEDESSKRMNTLLKGQVEQLETKNHLQTSQIETIEQLIVEKDSVIRSLRKQNGDLQHDGHKNQQLAIESELQCQSLQEKLAKLEEDLLRSQEMQHIQVQKIGQLNLEDQFGRGMIRDQQRHITDLETERSHVTELQSQLLHQKYVSNKQESQYSALKLSFENKSSEFMILTQSFKALEIDLKTMQELYESKCIQMENFDIKVKAFEQKQATIQQHVQSVTKSVETNSNNNVLLPSIQDESEQIELRVQQILAHERQETRLKLQQLEHEINRQEAQTLEVRLENESLLVQVSELNQTLRQIRMSRQTQDDSNTQLIKSLYQKLDEQTEKFEVEKRVLDRSNQELNANLVDLKFEVEVLMEKCNFYVNQFEVTKRELHRLEEQASISRNQFMQSETQSERQQKQLSQESQDLKQKVQSLQRILEDQHTSLSEEIRELKSSQRGRDILSQTLLEKQERITARWKEELALTSTTYEKIIEELKSALKHSQTENVNWRTEVYRAVKIKQARQSKLKEDESTTD